MSFTHGFTKQRSNTCRIDCDTHLFAGSTDPFEGGEVTLQDLWAKAQEVCARANVDQPFMCLDLTYITTLLQDGYDLKPTTKIKVSILIAFCSVNMLTPFRYETL